MRPSKFDKWIFFFSLIVFLYTFFAVGIHVTYYKEGEVDNVHIVHRASDIKTIEFPTSVIICPIICIMFFIFWVFEKELESVSIRNSWIRLRLKIINRKRR